MSGKKISMRCSKARRLSQDKLLALFKEHGEVRAYFGKDFLAIYPSSGEYYQLGKLEYIQVLYLERAEEEGGYYASQTSYFPLSLDVEAVAEFHRRLHTKVGIERCGCGYSLEYIAQLRDLKDSSNGEVHES